MDPVPSDQVDLVVEEETSRATICGSEKKLDATFDSNQNMKKIEAKKAAKRLPETANGEAGPAPKIGCHDVEKDIGSSSTKNGKESTDLIISTSKRIRERKENEQPFLLQPKVIPRNEPKVGDFVFAMFKNLEHPWFLAEVLEIIPDKHREQLEFVVHFEPTTIGRTPKPTVGVEIPGETERKVSQVTLKMLAPPNSCPFQLPVGSRVIAKMEEEARVGQFYSGIVADIPKPMGKPKNYLIFFDTGYAEYVHAEHVYLIRGSDRHVWNDVHPDSYDFIKEYLTKYPSWPLVTVRVGQIVATEWNGMWFPTRVRQVDGSLAYVQFECNGMCQWIFRGSGRLRVVPTRLLEDERIRIENGIVEPPMKKCYLSRKKSKCSRFQAVYKEVRYFAGDRDAKDFSIELDDPSLCIEYQGRLRRIEIPKSCPQQRPFINHDCDESCVHPLIFNEQIRRLSPLAIPFFFGWTRCKITEPTKHEIFYRAPCGVRLCNAKVLTDFLKLTQSNLSIDHFCFDYDVDCENEFVPARVLLNIDDISGGLEIMSVPLVNSIDWEAPPQFEYLTESILGPGVTINTDKDFLVCCDCENGDCSDQDKCSCWQLTKKGIAFTDMNMEEFPTRGYENKRLAELLASAVFECNERCRCKKSCTNRVVQNGLLWPLQVYKTRDKGWGVRTLFDIPLGTFLGYYVGEIYEYDYADNLDTGDEYFLGLDYIETVERRKADYESDCADIDSDEDEGDGSGSPLGPYEVRKKKREHRKLYGLNQKPYTVDSKRKGNITRFMNHSCNPNLFPQNVFVDTHDLRFPMVALFSDKHIRAGSELNWDYNYTPGTVVGVTMNCKCNAYTCKGRLL